MATCGQPKVQTNPRYKSFTQAVFTAGDEAQFEQLLPRQGTTRSADVDLSANIFADQLSLLSWDQVELEKHGDLNSRDVFNTFAYIFYKFKKGIFVGIHDGDVSSFLPFSNAAFRNEWSRLVKVNLDKYPNVQALADKVSALSGYRSQKVLPLDEWQANDGMFRYEFQHTEGDNNVLILQDMFATLAQTRPLPNLEFYVNRRDFPLLRQDNTEPYFNLYGTTTQPLVSHSYDRYAPIFSCSTAAGFADLAIPTYEDWARIQWQTANRTFPNACKQYPAISPSVPWSAKRPVAVFRGSSTGTGTTIKTNQRLKALAIADSERNGGRLDVGITTWNLRPRKHITSKYLETIERDSYPVANKMSLQEQSNFKYILTLEGHVAAYRLSYELSSGSVVLLAESKWKMWYYKFLQPYIHYVPVKEDLSDLLDKIDWCRDHDEQCRVIAESAKSFYDRYLGETGVLDYLQRLLVDVASTVGQYFWLPNLLNLSIDYEERWLAEEDKTNRVGERYAKRYAYPIAPGPRCVGRLDAARSVLLAKKDELRATKTLFTSSSVSVDLVETNGFQTIRKKALTELKRRENAHEAYLGLKAINTLVAKCPNFAYIYGLIDDHVFMEYIPGMTLREWLLSPQYNFADYVSILLQLNLALATAQNYAAFVHYDLYPWNVIVQTIREPTSFDYHVGKGIVYRYRTTVIPIMIDFGKSRAIVHDVEYGLTDSGFTSLYRSSKSLDTLTLLYSTLNVLGQKLAGADMNSLLEFAKRAQVAPDRAGWQHVKYMSKYGALVSFVNEHVDPLSFGPLEFVDFLQTRISRSASRLEVAVGLDLKMSRGYPSLELAIMATGNVRSALLETILKINKQTIPVSSDAVTSAVIANLVERRIADLDEKVRTSDAVIKSKYATVRRLIASASTKIETELITIDFPTVRYVQLDSQITPEFLDEYAPMVQFSPVNWLAIWAVCSEAAITDPRLDVFNTRDFDSFEFFDQIASNNTVLAIKGKIEKALSESN